MTGSSTCGCIECDFSTVRGTFVDELRDTLVGCLQQSSLFIFGRENTCNDFHSVFTSLGTDHAITFIQCFAAQQTEQTLLKCHVTLL